MVKIISSRIEFGATPADPTILAVKKEGDALETLFQTKDGKTFATTGTPAKSISGDALRESLSVGMKEVNEAGNQFATHELDMLAAIEKEHGKLFSGAESPFKTVLKTKKFADAYAAATLDPKAKLSELGKLMVTEKDAAEHLKLLPDQTSADFRKALSAIDKDAVEHFQTDVKRATQLSEKISGIDFTKAEFQKIANADKHVDEILAGFHGAGKDKLERLKGFFPADVEKRLVNTSYTSFDDAIAKFETKVTSAKTFFEGKATAIQKLKNEIATLETAFLPDSKAIAAKQKQITTLGKEIGDHLADNAAHAVGFKQLPDAVQTALKSEASLKASIETATAGVGKSIGEDAAKAAKKSTSIFYKTEEAMQKIVKEEKLGSIEDLKFLQKLNTPTKVGAVVVGAGLVAYLAGFGKRGKAAEMNEKQPQPLLQQGQVPDAGMAVGA